MVQSLPIQPLIQPKYSPFLSRIWKQSLILPVTKEGKRTWTKFVCPIIHSRKFREEHPYCPWMHPQFVKGTGCFAYQQIVDEDFLKQINYGNKEFKKIYDLRSGSERVFSRLLGLAMQNPSIRGLQTISNHCTASCLNGCQNWKQR